jgi:hypothetical protein
MAKQSDEPLRMSEVAALREILGHFNDARCVLECAVRSLEQKLLAEVYDQVDSTIARLAST